MGTVPYWRLSGFYLFYFASLGALIPYWGLYLKAEGFEPQEIGQLMAIIASTRIIAPNIWSWLADRSGHHVVLVRRSAFLGLACFLGIFAGHSFIWIALVLSMFSFFWNATLPQMEATTLAHLGKNSHHYSHIRLWGSIGFIASVLVLGWLFEQQSVMWLPVIVSGLFTAIWLTSLFVPEHVATQALLPTQSLWQVLRRPVVIALFIVCFLMQLGHGAYYTFYSIYLETNGYNRQMIGQLWAIGVLSEVLLFLVLHRLLTQFSLYSLLLTSLVLTGLRWLLVGYGIAWWQAIFIAQTLHAASFGLYHGVAMQFIYHYFPGRLQGRGQALYNSLTFGAGGAVGNLLSGYTWESLGASTCYLLSSFVCVIAIGISWRWGERL